MYVVRIIYNCILSHVTPQDVCLISFPRKNVSRMHYNFVFMVQHMMLCNFPSQDHNVSRIERNILFMIEHINLMNYLLENKRFLHSMHVSSWCLLNFLLVTLSRKQCNFVVTVQHMMFCKFSSREQSFLAITAISSSWYSTWCLLNFLFVNKPFLVYIATSCSCYTTWCLLNFPVVIARFSHTLQLHVHGTAHGICWNFFHMHALWTSSFSPLI